MKKNDSPFCFIHIPKTGGVTLHSVLIDQYPFKKRMSFVAKHEAHKFYDLPDAEKATYKLLKGHIWFDAEKFSANKDTIFFTYLRQPIQRTISHYYYLFQNPNHRLHKEMTENNYSLKQLYNMGKVLNLDNCMVRFISGNCNKDWDTMNEDDLALAIANFDKYFNHFGIQEYYDESLLILANQLGWKSPFYSRLNEGNKKKKEPFDAETQQMMIHFNRLDEKLYKHALDKFLLLKEEHKDMLAKQLPVFQKKNKGYWTLRAFVYPYLGSRVYR